MSETDVTAEQNQSVEQTTVVAWKGFDKDLKCRDFQYEIGKTYEHAGRVQACEGGFHACENPLDVWAYYPVHNSRFCKVTLSGSLSRHGDDSKIAAARISVDAEVSIPGIVNAAVQYMLGLVKDALATPSRGVALTESDEGNSARIGSSGNSAQIGSSGDSAQIGSSGNSARIGSSGDSAQIGSSGDYAQIGSSGYYAQIGSSGDYAQIDATGKDSVVACAGYSATAKAGENGAICLTYRDTAGRARFAVGYVGENLKADTWYRVSETGEFEEIENVE